LSITHPSTPDDILPKRFGIYSSALWLQADYGKAIFASLNGKGL